MKYILGFIIFLPIFLWCSTDEYHKTSDNKSPGYLKNWRIMFWNTENLFDTYNDSLTDDEEFLPSGVRHWTVERYHEKLLRVYKVLLAGGMEKPPEIIGLCEIENRGVLLDLTRDTPLRYFNYGFVHYESRDSRGSDVALLYNPRCVRILESASCPVDLSSEGGGFTRDILFVRVLFGSGDPVSVFINHWPSKYGGVGRTEGFRRLAAETLKNLARDILVRFPDEPVIIMGDFNDPPESNSISLHMECLEPDDILLNDKLYNLSMNTNGRIPGSYKYQGIWEQLDQFIVNGILLTGKTGFYTDEDKFRIFAPGFLLEEDITYGGYKPFRTYNGMIYQAGFSDHLPVYIDLMYLKTGAK